MQHHDEILEHELPDNWVRKQMQSGQGYYVNVNTNEKTYDLDAVMASSGLQGRSNESRNGEHVITNAGKAISENINVHYTQLSNNRASKSLLDNVSTSELTWELLINNILKTISDLNYSAKNDIKARYVQESNSIVNSIRDLLGCSKMTSDGCQLLKKYPVLLPHHTNIMNSLSKMSLAARVAGGLWPSADAVHKMRYQAGQVLLSVRHFVAAAQELSITLSPMSESDIDFFDAKEFELVDWEILSRLETVSDSIMNGIADLVTVITRERRMSVQLIELIRKCVIEIGQMLSFLEDLQVLETPASRKLFHEFLLKKSQLYTASNDLVTASNAGDDFGPSNTLGVILECTTSVLEAVDETVLSTRQLFGVKGIIVHDDFQNYQEENTPLEDLYRRISSLHFSEADSNSAQNSSRRGSSSRAGPDSDGALYNNRSSRGRAEKRNPLVVDPKLTHRTSSLVVTDVENGGSSPGSLRSPEEFGSANKLAKFFGEDTNSAAGPKSADLMKPWFLKREMTNELSYNMEGAINGGTFPALVERLTAHEHQVNPVFATSFLMTFHLFGTSTQLLDELIGRFMLSSPDNLSQDEHYLWVTKKLSLIQIRVCNAFKAWLEHYWREEHDDVCLDRIYSFASGPMMQSQPALAARLQDLVSKRVQFKLFRSILMYTAEE